MFGRWNSLGRCDGRLDISKTWRKLRLVQRLNRLEEAFKDNSSGNIDVAPSRANH